MKVTLPLSRKESDMDQETFIALIRQSEATYYRVAKSILQKEEDVEDAVQESILKAWQKRNHLKEIALFRTWSTRILINTCYDFIRKKRPLLSFGDDPPEIEDSGGQPDTELYFAVRELPSKQRIVIVLYYVEGYTVAEIATMLRIPQGTVKSRLSKGRDLLKRALKEEL